MAPRRMGKQRRTNSKPRQSAQAEDLAVVQQDDSSSLILLQREGGTAWTFTVRPDSSPALAAPSELLQVYATAARGADREKYWWFISDGALDEIAMQLEAHAWCVVDEMLGIDSCEELRSEVVAARAAGKLQPSRLAGGRSGKLTSYVHSRVRGDLVGWFDGEEPGMWATEALSRYLTKLDNFVAELGKRVVDLAGICSRSKAMVTCYPGGGARYVRHCDNSCLVGKGERCNGRRLTAILYLNPHWKIADGGELRLFEKLAPAGRPPVADIQPLGDRLVLFYSDYRVPHEVLPSHSERFAITTWYFDAAEREAVTHPSSTTADQEEMESIQREIQKFEERFGVAQNVTM